MKYSIYLINLDDRPDRLVTSHNLLKAEDLDFERIPAVNGQILDENLFQTSNVLACWQSHLLAYETFLKSDADYALILEDDFDVKGKLFLRKNLPYWIAQEFDLLQIGFLSVGVFNKIRWIFEELQKIVFKLISFFATFFRIKRLLIRLRVKEATINNLTITVSSFFPGTHAYIISKKMATAIVSEGANNFSADEYFIALSKMRAFKMGRLWKSRIAQNESAPSISKRFVTEEKN